MQQHDLTQGSAAWLAHRAACWNASDAPAMLGCSPYKTRAQLIKEAATGITEEVDAGTQRLFDAGHSFEALARPLAEAIVGDDLSPLSGSIDAGLSRPLAASFDGLTFMGDVNWEHKSLNEALRAALPAEGVGDAAVGAGLPLHNRVQLEQQMAVSGADRSLFTASKWDGDTLVEARHCWYVSNPELRARIVAGWQQFEADVAAYKPAEVVPAVVAEPVQALPAVLVKVSGEIAITANFNAFETAFREFVAERLITEPKTDQDFADLDLQIKAMKGAEAALDTAEAQMLAQIASVDTAKKTKDMLAVLVRQHRLTSEKLLESEKQRRKAEIVANGQAALREHVAALQRRVGVALTAGADFAGVIKGKKSLASMEDAIATELARVKIEANRVADLIDANRKAMEEADAAGLFPDFPNVCTKAADDFAALIAGRRAAAAERLERERERIRAEEAARLEREQRAAAEAKAREEAAAQAQRDAEARAEQQRQEALVTPQQGTQQVLKAEAPAPDATARVAPAHASPVGGPMGAGQPAAAGPVGGHAPAPEVRAFPAPAVAELPTMTLGQLSTRLGFTVTADFLAGLGFEAHKDKSARLYRPSQFGAICEGISAHVLAVAGEKQAA